MAQPFKLEFAAPGSVADHDRATYFARLTGRLLAAVAAVLVVALLLAAELHLAPAQRLDMLGATTYAAP